MIYLSRLSAPFTTTAYTTIAKTLYFISAGFPSLSLNVGELCDSCRLDKKQRNQLTFF